MCDNHCSSGNVLPLLVACCNWSFVKHGQDRSAGEYLRIHLTVDLSGWNLMCFCICLICCLPGSAEIAPDSAWCMGARLTEAMFYMAPPPLVNTIGCRLVAVPTLHCEDSTTGAALLRCSHGGGRGAQNNFAPTLVLLRQTVHRSSGDLKTVFYMASPPCEHSNKTAPGMMPHCVLLPSHCTPILENPKRGTTESTHHSGRSSRRRWLVLTSLPTPNRPAAAP